MEEYKFYEENSDIESVEIPVDITKKEESIKVPEADRLIQKHPTQCLIALFIGICVATFFLWILHPIKVSKIVYKVIKESIDEIKKSPTLY